MHPYWSLIDNLLMFLRDQEICTSLKPFFQPLYVTAVHPNSHDIDFAPNLFHFADCDQPGPGRPVIANDDCVGGDLREGGSQGLSPCVMSGFNQAIVVDHSEAECGDGYHR